MVLKECKIAVNDVIHELREENRRLLNELIFADKCFNKLIKFKIFIELNSREFELNLDSNKLEEYRRVIKEVKQVLGEKNGFLMRYRINNKKCDENRFKLKIIENNTNVLKRGRGRPKKNVYDVKTMNTTEVKEPLSENGNENQSNKSVISEEEEIPANNAVVKRSRGRPKKSVSDGMAPKKHISDDKNEYQSYRSVVSKPKKELKFVCDYPNCEFESPTKRSLMSHVKWHSYSGPFRCHIAGCDKIIKNERKFQRHVESHDTDRHFRCPADGCDKRFRMRSLLKKHIRIHSERNIVCVWPGCEYRTIDDGSRMSRHIQQKHSTERTFACVWPNCEKKFKTNSTLGQHLRVHKKDKRHACPWPGCQYRAIFAATLRTHIRLKHKTE